MKEKILKKIFNIVWMSLIVIPIALGIVTMINGAVNSWSGQPMSNSEAFWFGAIMIYIFDLWPYIILALGYILFYIFYSIKSRK